MLCVGLVSAQKKPTKKPVVKPKPTQTTPVSTAVAAADTTKAVVPKKKRKPVQDGYIFKDSLYSDTPAPLAFVELKDVVYTKRIWRDIDFRDPGNKVLNSQIPGANLVGIIFKAVAAGELDMYSNNDENFQEDPFDIQPSTELETKYSRKKTSPAVENFLGVTIKEDKNGNSVPSLNSEDDNYFFMNFAKIRLKEDWILDGKRGVFEPRIIGVALIRKPRTADAADPNAAAAPAPAVTTNAALVPEPEGDVIGWFRFDELRDILFRVKIPNENNDFSGVTYDDIFMKRLFYSNITKESTAGDKLKELTINGRKLTPIELLRESERIKKAMADFEQGLWEY